MTIYQLLIQTVRHFWKQDLALALGVAVSTAVITGALIVGDSMRYSLEKIVELRLGQVTHTIAAADRYFTDSLAVRLEDRLKNPVTALLMLEGMATSDGGKYRLPKVQVLGVEDGFPEVAGAGHPLQNLAPYEAFINRNLAGRLNLAENDEFLVRIKKLSLIPLNAPLVSDEELVRPVTVKVAGILEEEEMGRFHLKNIQTAPFNVFLSLDFLNEVMGTKGKASHILMSGGNDLGKEEIEHAFSESWNLADINLEIRNNPLQGTWEITSDRVFIEQVIQDALQADPLPKEFILTYFVNTLSTEGRETPYSFVSSLPEEKLLPGEMIINEWLAEDLDAHPGDSVRMDYFVIGPLRELAERSARFVVKEIVPLENAWADETLTPHLPGLSDAGNCRDWEAGVPVDLEKIRTKDEAYWNQYQGTPKAFISIATAQALWQSRFGESTLIRFTDLTASLVDIERVVKNSVDPFQLGFKVETVRQNADLAAKSGVDFSQLFLGLSFFLVMAGILLTVLLFILNTENRMTQIGTLSFLGFTHRQVKGLLLSEGLLVSVAGAGLGLLVAVAYNQAVFAALNSIWMDIVRTRTLVTVLEPYTLFIGFFASVLVSFTAIYFYLNRLLKRQLQSLHSQNVKLGKKGSRTLKKLVMYVAGLTAVGLVIGSYAQNEVRNAGLFFAAGSLLLISLLLMVNLYFQEDKKIPETFRMTPSRLIRQNIRRNHTRSFLVVALFALGTFIIVSTGMNRKDVFTEAREKSSGTGGFLFFAESTIPVLRNLNDPAVRFEAGLEKEYQVVQLRSYQGDDASCLNLNRTTTPGILGVDPEDLSGRFSFVNKTEDLDADDPWFSLAGELAENTIPAIADQTVIQWGLGLKVGDTLQYLDENGTRLNLKLVGGLANSIFQGNVLISQDNFLRHFPSSSGSNVFLIDGPPEEKVDIEEELQQSFRDYGWMMQNAAERLAAFNMVENTYLSIFLLLGGLGLILGTVGLGIVLIRNLLSRRNELGVMQAVGFQSQLIIRILTLEHFYLLLAGVGTGLLSSLLVSLPSWLNPNLDVSLTSTFVIVGLLFLIGILWIVWLTWYFLKKERVVAALREE